RPDRAQRRGHRRRGAVRGTGSLDPRSSGQSLRAAAEAASRRVARSAAARAAAEDHDGGFPAEDLADLARLGLLAAPLPRAAGGYRLEGRKTFASGAGHVIRALVTARTEPGAPPLMLVVPLDPGTRHDLSAWRAQGMRASATGTVDFSGLAIGPDAILGGPD